MYDRGNMQAQQAMQGPNIGGIELGGFTGQEKPMDLKTHKRLYDLAHNVRAFIDAQGGLTYQESCRFGQIMQEIINLK